MHSSYKLLRILQAWLHATRVRRSVPARHGLHEPPSQNWSRIWNHRDNAHSSALGIQAPPGLYIPTGIPSKIANFGENPVPGGAGTWLSP